MENIYLDEIQKTAAAMENHAGQFRFALVADSHMDDSVPQTVANMAAVDAIAPFDCVIHLGDMINGNIPKRYSQIMLDQQMALFRQATGSGRLYPVMGNHDEHIGGCTARFWQDATAFLAGDSAVCRPGAEAYFYVDDPARKIRLVVISSFFYQYREDGKRTKPFGISPEQIAWLENQALAVDGDWTVLLFSHDTPFSEFDESRFLTENRKVNGTLAIETLLRAKQLRGFRLAGWLVGHYHGDLIARLGGIPFILIGDQTAYTPQLWVMPQGGCYYDRQPGTVTEDLWDAVAVDTENRKLHLYRFGAGQDRVVEF